MNTSLSFLKPLLALFLSLLWLARPTYAAGEVWAWGSNRQGGLGDGTLVNRNAPVRMSGLTNVTAVGGGHDFTLAVKSDGRVWACGNNVFGQLGDGSTNSTAPYGKTTPVQVLNLTGVSAVDGGELHAVALKSDGTVWTWGYNASGQLGDGATSNSSVPVKVTGLTGIIGVSAGNNHTLALKSDGTVWSWGENRRGQLGDGTTMDYWPYGRSSAQQIGGLTGITAISACGDHSVALKSDGTVWTWGWNSFGQLGDGTDIDRNVPVQVSGLTNVVAVCAGHGHTVALKSDGTVRAWGGGALGQLGDGLRTSSLTPVQVSNLTNVTTLGGGGAFTIAMKSDKTLWTWGDNDFGELGDGTTTGRAVPVRVIGLTGITNFCGGAYHAIAIQNAPVVISPFSITGRITNHSGVGMVGISVTRPGGASATTDLNGNYIFRNVPKGTYTIAPLIPPSLSGVTMYPASRSVTLTNSSLNNMSFVASFTVTGRLANHSGTGIPNVQIKRVAGTSAVSVFTDASGSYKFTDVRSGSYSISPVLTPSMSGMSFTPSTTNITVDRSNLTNINFIGMFSISGRVTTSAGVAIPNVLVRLGNGSTSTTVQTDAQGNYKFSGVRSGTYSITPTLSGKTFTPASRSGVVVSTLNVGNQNFTGSN